MPVEMRVLKAMPGHSITQIIATAQGLEILDCLSDHGKTLDSLAVELALDNASLFRLMRGLIYIGIVEKNAEAYYLTKAGIKLSKQGVTVSL